MSWLAFVPLVVNLLSLLMGHDDAELVFVGDAMQHQAQIDAARREDGVWSYDGCFDALKIAVENADYAVVNLETPLGPPAYTGYPCFNAPGSWAGALASAGFDLFLTANNHTLDRRARGLKNTIDTLDARGLEHIGTYASDSLRRKTLPFVRNISGIKVGFVNYTYGTNGFSPSDGVVVDYLDRARITSDVTAARKAGAEIIIACVHWGDEYVLLPNKAQRDMGDFLESIGVDVIIGAHPHVIQPLEFRPNRYFPHKEVFIAWSLGNFISNMRTTDTRGGMLTRIWLHRGDDGVARLHGGEYELLFTVPASGKGTNYRVMPAAVRPGIQDPVPPEWRAKRDAFLHNARRILDKHNIKVSEHLPGVGL